MFNLYQNIGNKKDESNNDERNTAVIGHERFYQGPSTTTLLNGSSKKRTKGKALMPRRTQSTSEFSPSLLKAAFKNSRSHSLDRRQLLLNKRNIDKLENTKPIEEIDNTGSTSVKSTAIFEQCLNYFGTSERYKIIKSLPCCGRRNNKYWCIVQDAEFGSQRLLTVVNLKLETYCRPSPTLIQRDSLMSLFQSLHHPYIHPVLDIGFYDNGISFITPLNQNGSLRDLIYNSNWCQSYDNKYVSKSTGLPLKMIQCLGRQMLEGLMFLKSRQMPAYLQLHSGNVIIQNGVARLAGIENYLFEPFIDENDSIVCMAFGYVLFEMATGYSLNRPPTPAHLQLELESLPKVAEVLANIFPNHQSMAGCSSIKRIINSDLFRGVELRELRGVSSLSTPTDRSHEVHSCLLDYIQQFRLY